MIDRKITSSLIKYLEFFPVVAIIGSRQVGKTTLAKQIMHSLKKPVTYLDLERLEDLARLNNPSLYFEKKQDECIILDEIQRRPELFPELRSIIDRNRQSGRFLILGSASPDLLKQSSETLAGRISYTELTPIQLLELDEGKQDQLWFRGGYPTPLLTDDDEIRNVWYNSFVTTYIERDLPLLGLNTSSLNLRRFLNMLSGIQGSTLNIQMLSRSLGVSSTTIVRYLEYFENSFLIRKLQPYYTNIRKRLVKSPKVYIRDTGLLHFLHGIVKNNSLWDSAIVGVSWESFVVNQIMSNLNVNMQAWYYRTQDGTECDLLLTVNDKPEYCIEVKLSSAPKKTRSLTTAINDLKTKKNFIIIPECDESYDLSNSIKVCNLYEFVNKWLK